MEATVAELTEKIDALAAQVQYLTAQAQAAERARDEREELTRDLMRVADDGYALAARQFEEMQEFVNADDLLRLIKHLVRNGRNFEALLEQLESMTDLMAVLGPIGNEAFDKGVALMDAADRKGYFALARGGVRIADNVVASFGEDDVRKLGDNVVLILNVIKDMTQPQIMQFVRSTLLVAAEEVEKPVDASLLGLAAQMRDPAVRRGLALTMRVLHVIGAQAEPKARVPAN